jgi:hypothetical protein
MDGQEMKVTREDHGDGGEGKEACLCVLFRMSKGPKDLLTTNATQQGLTAGARLLGKLQPQLVDNGNCIMNTRQQNNSSSRLDNITDSRQYMQQTADSRHVAGSR